MDPISALKAIEPIQKACAAIAKLLSHAQDLAKDDAKYYATYIEIAGEAIKGLEAEYLAILRQAAGINIDQPSERKALLKRIGDYIHGEELRPKLRLAIDRLRIGREALQEHADKLLVWPGAKEKRAAALAKFDMLLNDLAGYLGSLGDYSGPSAVGLDELKSIEAELAKNHPEKRKFNDMIDELLMNLDKSKLICIAGDCGRVIETLRIAFR